MNVTLQLVLSQQANRVKLGVPGGIQKGGPVFNAGRLLFLYYAEQFYLSAITILNTLSASPACQL